MINSDGLHSILYLRYRQQMFIFAQIFLKMMPKNFKTTLWIVGIAIILMFGIFAYFMSRGNNMTNFMLPLMLIFGLVLGGIIMFLASRKLTAEPPVITESSHTIAESMRKVFKVVSAEGQFNEVYNYEETSKLLNFIPSKKKALVIVKGKVLIGYDFEKLKWEVDEVGRKVRLLEFPHPEILSTETDYQYYNIEEQFFNLFGKDDLARIQENGKKQIVEAAKNSNLPNIAAEQMRTLMMELLEAKNFTLENASKITENRQIGFNGTSAT